MQLINIYLIAFVACLSSPCASSSKSTNTRQWLNDVLEAGVQTDDPQRNFVYAADKLKDGLKGLETRRMSPNLLKSEILEFLSLRSLTSDTECGFESYRVLSTNNRSNGNNAHRVLNSVDHLTRVDRILYVIMSEHAKSCRDIHYARFPEARATLDQDTSRKVATIFDPLIASNYGLIARPHLAYRDTIMDNFLPAIEILAQQVQDGDSKLLFSLGKKLTTVHSADYHAKIDRMLQEYFFGPCERYVQIMRPYYDIVLFDNKMVSVSQNRNDESVKDFRRSKQRYLLCQKVTGSFKSKLADKFWKVIKASTKSYEKPE